MKVSRKSLKKTLVAFFAIGLLLVLATPVLATAGVWGSSGNDMYYNDGNIGIGTSTPSAHLDVLGNFRATSLYNGTASFVVRPNNLTGQSYGMTAISSGGLYLGRTNGPGSAVEDDIFIKSSNGAVGINTTNPSTQLDVNGNIKTKASTNGGASFVVTPNDGTSQNYGMTAVNGGGGLYIGRTNGPGQGVEGDIRIYPNGNICLGNC
jgi:hypothetical protein